MFETTTCGSRSASNLAGRAPLGSESTTKLCSRGWLRQHTIYGKRPGARGAAPDAAQVLVRGLGQPGREVGRGVVHGQLAADAELAEVGVLLEVLPLPVLLLLVLQLLQLLARLGGASSGPPRAASAPGPGRPPASMPRRPCSEHKQATATVAERRKDTNAKPASHWRPGPFCDYAILLGPVQALAHSVPGVLSVLRSMKRCNTRSLSRVHIYLSKRMEA